MSTKQRYDSMSTHTSFSLGKVAGSAKIREVSKLSLPEIEAVVQLVSRTVPAGNVPGMILAGLARLSERKTPLKNVRRDVDLLFMGIERTLDKAVYGAFFAGPAAVLWGYQNLLRLAGKNPEDAFPEGTWQFYCEYALREDTARHTNETHGFDSYLKEANLRLTTVDRMTAWVMASIHTLHQYDDLLRNEWRERVYTTLLADVTRNRPELGAFYAGLYRQWERKRPYRVAPGTRERYASYRRNQFERFLEEVIRYNLPNDCLHEWLKRVQAAESSSLASYLCQMSIHGYLEPGIYGEARSPVPLDRLYVGLIYGGRYYLIPTCEPGTSKPISAETVRSQISALVTHPSDSPPLHLTSLAKVKRAALVELRAKMGPDVIRELDLLHLAPVLLNFDRRFPDQTLSKIRQGERGMGDHALTIFDTGQTFVFDQSHIFFDGAWGAALAEIITNEALEWAEELQTQPVARPGNVRPYALRVNFTTSQMALIEGAPMARSEAGAETDAVKLRLVMSLRKLFKLRSDHLNLTVNDLLILYRAIHAITYEPHPYLAAALQKLVGESRTQDVGLAALDVIYNSKHMNPAVLIPIDASRRNPADRLYPMSFEVPLRELDLLGLHTRTLEALAAYEGAKGDRSYQYTVFERFQQTYLATLAGFGAVLSRAREVAYTNESVSASTLKLLAHVPTPLQRLLDHLPNRFDVLNDLIRGREVFSNIGQVVPTSTLTRFATAKDDNDKKTLVWGVMTDSQGVLRITLRDFRPHVNLLHNIGRDDLATWMAQDYVDAYARGFNTFIQDLRDITSAFRETVPTRK
jgi:hypothetical protein